MIENMNKCQNVVDQEAGTVCGGQDFSIDHKVNEGDVSVGVHCNLCSRTMTYKVNIMKSVESEIADLHNKDNVIKST